MVTCCISKAVKALSTYFQATTILLIVIDRILWLVELRKFVQILLHVSHPVLIRTAASHLAERTRYAPGDIRTAAK